MLYCPCRYVTSDVSYDLCSPTRLRNKTTTGRSQAENVAVANALQLEVARHYASPFCFNYDAMPSLKSLYLSMAVL